MNIPNGELCITTTCDCNYRCPWCLMKENLGADTGPMPPADFEKVMRRVCEAPYQRYVLSGGEPTLYPEHLLDMVRVIRSVQPSAEFLVATNGTQLTLEFADRLNRAGAAVRVSVEPSGYKNFERLLANAARPLEVFEAMRRLNRMVLRMVLTPEKIRNNRLAEDILLLGGFFSGKYIEAALDMTRYGDYTTDDMKILGGAVKAVLKTEPEFAKTLSLLMSFTHKCVEREDRYDRLIGGFVPGCDKSGSDRGCVMLTRGMKPDAYKAYIECARLLTMNETGASNHGETDMGGDRGIERAASHSAKKNAERGQGLCIRQRKRN